MSLADAVRSASSRHQVVGVVGARGTGKTRTRDALVEHFNSTDVSVLSLDAGSAESLDDLNGPLSSVLACRPSLLTASAVPPTTRIRVIIDNGHELFGRPWVGYFQDQWRALLAEQQARGRIGVILLGRPIFRSILGGRGSPLLNLGTVITVQPLAVQEISQAFLIDETLAVAIRKKTGGHPALCGALVAALDGDIKNMKDSISAFAAEKERYLMRLAEDHTSAGVRVFADLIRVKGPIGEAALISKHFGEAYARGKDCLDDLVGSGLASRDDHSCYRMAAELYRHSAIARRYLTAATREIPDACPEEHLEAAHLLFEIENRLRTSIVRVLGELDHAWWPARIPEELVGDAESRRRVEDDSRVGSVEPHHPIMYLTLGELISIVEATENWTNAFDTHFGISQKAFETFVGDVIAVRNKVAHSRPATGLDVEVLRIAGTGLRLLTPAD